MGKGKKKKPVSTALIAQNRKVRHEYFLEEFFEAGLVLQGWEVKSLRAGRANLSDAYVMLKDGEAFLFGCHFEALNTVSTHITPDPIRTRKLLLHQRELGKIFGAVQRKGYACVPVKLHWVRGRAKCDIALAKGKQKVDKRRTEKERDWKRQKQRLMKQN